jgi:hypothetical protein
MGANYWGRCYYIGAAFFIAALLMPIDLTLAPLIFGLLWSAVLGHLGVHLGKQGRKVEQERVPTPSQSATVMFQDKK